MKTLVLTWGELEGLCIGKSLRGGLREGRRVGILRGFLVGTRLCLKLFSKNLGRVTPFFRFKEGFWCDLDLNKGGRNGLGVLKSWRFIWGLGSSGEIFFVNMFRMMVSGNWNLWLAFGK